MTTQQRERFLRGSEFLGSVYISGHLHAAFPTALRTLCLIECLPRGELMTLYPDCAECLRVISAWEVLRMTGQIESSGIPREWLMAA